MGFPKRSAAFSRKYSVSGARVVHAFAKRGDGHVVRTQPEEEIAPERALFDHFFQGLVGGYDDPCFQGL